MWDEASPTLEEYANYVIDQIKAGGNKGNFRVDGVRGRFTDKDLNDIKLLVKVAGYHIKYVGSNNNWCPFWEICDPDDVDGGLFAITHNTITAGPNSIIAQNGNVNQTYNAFLPHLVQAIEQSDVDEEHKRKWSDTIQDLMKHPLFNTILTGAIQVATTAATITK